MTEHKRPIHPSEEGRSFDFLFEAGLKTKLVKSRGQFTRSPLEGLLHDKIFIYSIVNSPALENEGNQIIDSYTDKLACCYFYLVYLILHP